jgi:hypothetical protein
MEVRISLDQSQPPVGRLTVTSPAGGHLRTVPFAGWLGLLRALSDAVDSSGAFPPAPSAPSTPPR